MKLKTFLPSLLISTLLGGAAGLHAAVVVIDDFEAGEGHFASATNASGSIRRVLASSTAEQNFVEFFQGSASQQLIINRNPDTAAPAPAFPSGPGEWFLRHLSGGGTIANNTSIPNTGTTWVGYWIKTTSSNLEAGIILDDNLASGNAHEIAVFQPVIGDGMWHLYQYELSNANSWENFAPGTNNPGGEINNATVTIDSLAFRGKAGVLTDTETFHIDNVTYSTDGPIPVPEPSALAFAGLGALALARRKQ
ncbi:MAG: PEP-CTERM sorting domain-containing protein [Verrucomicrobiota bacterium]